MTTQKDRDDKSSSSNQGGSQKSGSNNQGGSHKSGSSHSSDKK